MQQRIAMLDCESGEVVEQILRHEGNAVREFYAALPRPVVVGIEATGSMGWFLRLPADLDITCRVGRPAAIRRAVWSGLRPGTTYRSRAVPPDGTQPERSDLALRRGRGGNAKTQRRLER
jgi:transposase